MPVIDPGVAHERAQTAATARHAPRTNIRAVGRQMAEGILTESDWQLALAIIVMPCIRHLVGNDLVSPAEREAVAEQ